MSAVTTAFDQESRSTRNVLLGALIIIAMTLIAYIPAMTDGGFIWDDDSYVTENEYVTGTHPKHPGFDGLLQMWIPLRTPQYYPVVFTTFWIEHQLWGLHPRGYHVVNILIHALNAVLVFLLARRLKLPWAWLIGAIWALHPVNVESVAWITERKNTLSACFYLLAALAYLRFDDDKINADADVFGDGWRRWLFYAAALLCFLMALLSKSVTCSLPAALVLMRLWQRRPISPVPYSIVIFAGLFLSSVWVERKVGSNWIVDVAIAAAIALPFVWGVVRAREVPLAPLAPFFIIGLALALNTAHIERVKVGATGEAFAFSIADRFLIASKALLFYPYTVIKPWPVMFIYPRWTINDSQVVQYWSIVVVALIAAGMLVLYRRGWRGPGLALAFFAGTVFPALGFVNVYPMIFSFVADHFQYLASLGVIAIVVGSLATILRTPQRMVLVAIVVLPVLGGMTWVQSMTYFNAETVWRDTLAKNDEAFMPHNNLATELLKRGEIAHEQGRPDEAQALLDEADAHLQRALQIKPRYENALTNIADVRRLQRRYEEGLQYAQQALDLIYSDPDVQAVLTQSGPRPVSTPLSEATWHVGRLKELLGRNDEALGHYRDAMAWNPKNATVQVELVRLLMKMGRDEEAAPEYEALIQMQPDNAGAMTTLASIRQKQGRDAEARDLYAQAIAAAGQRGGGDSVAPLMRLVRLLSTSADPKVRDTKQAVLMMQRLVQQSQRRDPALLDIFASVLAADGRVDEAIRTAEEAAALADQMQAPELAKEIRARADQYRGQGQSPLLGPTTVPR